MKRVLGILLVIGCGGGGGATGATSPSPPPATPAAVAADFAMICTEAERALGAPAPEGRATAFATAVTGKLQTEAARATFAAAGMEPGDRKEAVLAQGAAESGVPGWTCPAVTTLYAAP